MILCGGKGTRLRSTSEALAKPLVEIGGMPVLWHVVRIYAAQGFTDFILLTGHRGDQIQQFADSCEWPPGTTVTCLDTGEDSQTGERVRRAFELRPSETTCITYADGVAPVDLSGLLDFHSRTGLSATMTIVRPELPFGVAMTDGDLVTGFVEKPTSTEWINGGFMVFEHEALSEIEPGEVLERELLERLASQRRLGGYRHDGFWFCMDTWKDQIVLNELWQDGDAPWAIWS